MTSTTRSHRSPHMVLLDRFDIVDTLSYQAMQDRGLTFDQIIALSVHD
jgi:hypothetical protein